MTNSYSFGKLGFAVERGDEKVIDGQVSAEIFLAVFSYVPVENSGLAIKRSLDDGSM
ncbi:hypothetical protein DAPPUDRAFT_247146 [Daphnia pulex]|uniref:Uncharacterized protein n=1 Tax=Daphnia pulex TaxID=6669 RepID=E9GRU9_DAPPU|nr:hypothetical protein DAPPUDRAFT_247146 [Daphnia pulex]|eukprot:EFX77837.1 hypothetical protein DAPPUDRAFT_247146 [Daphnia pulex]